MISFPQGQFPIEIAFHLNNPNGTPFSVAGLEYSVKMLTSRGEITLDTTTLSVENNCISWLIPVTDQFIGSYTILVNLKRNGIALCEVRHHEAFAFTRSDNEPSLNDAVRERTEDEGYAVSLFAIGTYKSFLPSAPVAGTDGYWYIDGVRTSVPTVYNLEYNERDKMLIISQGKKGDVNYAELKYITAISDYIESLEGAFDDAKEEWDETFQSAESERSTTFTNAEASRSATFDDAEELRSVAENARKAAEINRETAEANRQASILAVESSLNSRSLITETGNKITLEIDNESYKLKAKMYDKNNNLINTSNEIDLPLEEMITFVTYDETTKELVFNLKSGQSTRCPISSIIAGLATQSWVTTQLGGKQDTITDIDTIRSNSSSGGTHATNTNNPHNVTKAQLGLDKVNNTSDAEKSVAYATASDVAQNATDHIADNNNPHNVTKAQIGLGNVDNTADANKTVSHAQTSGEAYKFGGLTSRQLWKSDASGNLCYLLIADVTAWKGSTADALPYGFAGTSVICRDSGYLADGFVQIMCRVQYSDTQGYIDGERQLWSTDSNIKPCVVKYNNKYYLALAMTGGGRSFQVSGRFYNCLDTFIEIIGDSHTTCPSVEVIYDGSVKTIIDSTNIGNQSVSYATNSDTAKKATTAISANTANNASQLGGIAAASYQKKMTIQSMNVNLVEDTYQPNTEYIYSDAPDEIEGYFDANGSQGDEIYIAFEVASDGTMLVIDGEYCGELEAPEAGCFYEISAKWNSKQSKWMLISCQTQI